MAPKKKTSYGPPGSRLEPVALSSEEGEIDLSLLPRRLQTEIIQVNAQGVVYQVHRDLLIERSDFFQSMHRSGFLKAGTPVDLQWRQDLSLDEAFESVLMFMYTQRFTREGKDDQERCLHAAFVYVFADYLGMDQLQRLALAQFKAELARNQVQYNRWGENEGAKKLVSTHLDPRTVIILHSVLYDNAFATDLKADVDEVTHAAHQPGPSVSLSENSQVAPEAACVSSQIGFSKTVTPMIRYYSDNVSDDSGEDAFEDRSEVPVQDPRTAAREAFVQCVRSNLPNLMKSKHFQQLYSTGGDFALDVLAFMAKAI